MKEIEEIAALEQQIALLGAAVEELEDSGAEVPKSLIDQLDQIKERIHRLHVKQVLRYCLVSN